MPRRCYDVGEIDFSFVNIGFFKTPEEADKVLRKLNKAFYFFITKYHKDLWAVSLSYRVAIDFDR